MDWSRCHAAYPPRAAVLRSRQLLRVIFRQVCRHHRRCARAGLPLALQRRKRPCRLADRAMRADYCRPLIVAPNPPKPARTSPPVARGRTFIMVASPRNDCANRWRDSFDDQPIEHASCQPPSRTRLPGLHTARGCRDLKYVRSASARARGATPRLSRHRGTDIRTAPYACGRAGMRGLGYVISVLFGIDTRYLKRQHQSRRDRFATDDSHAPVLLYRLCLVRHRWNSQAGAASVASTRAGATEW